MISLDMNVQPNEDKVQLQRQPSNRRRDRGQMRKSGLFKCFTRSRRASDDTAVAAASLLAIMHQQNMEHNQKMVQVKQEMNIAEANLKSVETNLEEAKDDLEAANETVQHQLLATDIWQRRFDELEALVSGQVDRAAIAAIRNRSLADGH